MDRRTFAGAALAAFGLAPARLWAQSASSSASSSPVPIAPPAPDPDFLRWKAGFIARATAKGFRRDFVIDTLAAMAAPDAAVLAIDRKVTDIHYPVSHQVAINVTPDHIQALQAKLAANTHIAEIETAYGVPRSILGGIWTMETRLGTIQGGFDVVTALATLAYAGHRAQWAEGELLEALRILDGGLATRAQMIGAWDAGMGQTQFEPSTYLKLAVDGDHDGRIDIWGSDADALASAANYLSKAGWSHGDEWAVEVQLPDGFDYALSEGPKRPVADWLDRGLHRADRAPWPGTETAQPAALYLPAGAAGPVFLLLHNHQVIKRYNNSDAYALCVGLIADAQAGAPPTVAAWPVERPMTRAQRMAAQGGLKAAGYDPGPVTGTFGTQSRAALRRWQKAHGRPADGYLNADLADELARVAM